MLKKRIAMFQAPPLPVRPLPVLRLPALRLAAPRLPALLPVRRLPALLLPALLLLVLALGLSACSCSAGRAVQADAAELLSLGEQYLTELDYDQALVQFLNVIEIEPRNVRAYLGAAEAYAALGQTEEAVAILERGLEETGDAGIAARLEELRSEAGSGTGGLGAKLTAEQLALLEPLEAALLAMDIEAASPGFISGEYQDLIALIPPDENIIYKRTANQIWSLALSDDHADGSTDVRILCWLDGRDDGIHYKAQWLHIGLDETAIQMSKVQYSGGEATGPFERVRIYDGVWNKETGNVLEGYYHGEVLVTTTWDEGIATLKETYQNGRIQVIREEEDSGYPDGIKRYTSVDIETGEMYARYNSSFIAEGVNTAD